MKLFVYAVIATAIFGTTFPIIAAPTESKIAPPPAISSYEMPAMEIPKKSPETWSSILENQFDERSTIVMSDSFGWFAGYRWTRSQISDDYSLNKEINDVGRHAMKRSILSAVRGGFIQMMPGIYESRNWFADLLVNSVGYTPSQSVDPTETAAPAMQLSWLASMHSSGSINYGYAVFSDGNIWGSIRLGRFNGHPMMILGRIHYDPSHWDTLVASEQFSFYALWSSVVSIGGSYDALDGFKKGGSAIGPTWTASISHYFGKNWYDPAIVVSGTTNNNEQNVLLSFNWSFR